MDFEYEEREPMTPRLQTRIQSNSTLGRTAPRTMVVFSRMFPDGHAFSTPIKIDFVACAKK